MEWDLSNKLQPSELTYNFYPPIKLSCDVKENPGPETNSCDCLSICHWNLNSICAHNFIKLSLLRSYISVNKIDIIRLSETYLDLGVPSDDGNFELPGYNLVWANNPTNTKRGGFVFIIIIPYP